MTQKPRDDRHKLKDPAAIADYLNSRADRRYVKNLCSAKDKQEK